MSAITIPYHLLLPIFIGISILIILGLKREKLFQKKYSRWFWRSMLVFVFFYLFIVGSALFEDIYHQWRVNTFDLNGDGVFSGEELTPELEKAMFELTNDVGRNFSFITTLIPALLVSAFFYVVGLLTELIKSKLKDDGV